MPLPSERLRAQLMGKSANGKHKTFDPERNVEAGLGGTHGWTHSKRLQMLPSLNPVEHSRHFEEKNPRSKTLTAQTFERTRSAKTVLGKMKHCSKQSHMLTWKEQRDNTDGQRVVQDTSAAPISHWSIDFDNVQDNSAAPISHWSIDFEDVLIPRLKTTVLREPLGCRTEKQGTDSSSAR